MDNNLDNNNRADYPEDFDPADVSKPRAIRKEIDIVAEQRANLRKQWIRTHRVQLFIVLGVIVAVLAFIGVKMYIDSANPLARFMKASSKNLDSPFSFEMTLGRDGEELMKYNGTADIDRSSQRMKIFYSADYTDYSYSSATVADGSMFAGGSLYDGVWRVSDCEEKIHDFFDFDTDFRKGGFDAGAFLRFTKLSTSYSTEELNSFMESFLSRLSGSSDIAEIKTENIEGGMRFVYDVNIGAILDMIVEDGAPIFRRSDDYYDFKARCEANSKVIHSAKCTMTYIVNGSGNLTSLLIEAKIGEEEYSLKAGFSGFGSTEVLIPEEFLTEAAKLYEAEEE